MTMLSFVTLGRHTFNIIESFVILTEWEEVFSMLIKRKQVAIDFTIMFFCHTCRILATFYKTLHDFNHNDLRES